MRIERALDRAHQPHRLRAVLLDQVLHLVQPHAVLAGAGAFQRQGTCHQLVVERLGGKPQPASKKGSSLSGLLGLFSKTSK